MLSEILFLACALPIASAAETVLGAYIVARHGDRSPKITPPVNLTTLGYSEIFTAGSYFRSRYVASNANHKIAGVSTDIVKQSQLAVSSPLDTVLQNSATAFLQGLYPPVKTTETLRNGTQVESPLGGYQLIPVSLLSSGTASEAAGWLQGASGCVNAISSSNSYYSSKEYMDTYTNTLDFYKKLTPAISGVFSGDHISFHDAFTIWDLLNVADIHNQSNSFAASEVYPSDVAFQARTLADRHEWGLAYNASEPIRNIAGSVLASQIVNDLNKTITSKGSFKLSIQFNAYATFFAFFGPANLSAASTDFMGVPDYASTMTFELFTNEPASPFPSADKINVRFLWHNGTVSNISEPTVFPLFGGSATSLPWNDFATAMGKFSVPDQMSWCKACGNSTGVCATADTSASSSSSSSANSSGSSSGISNAVAGVIGAMVTLAVVLGLLALVLLVGGFRLAKKGRRSTGSVSSNSLEEGKRT